MQIPDPIDPKLEGKEVFVTKQKVVGNRLRKNICSVLFHPVFGNLVLVLTEGGEIHAIDTFACAVVHQRIAVVKINSNWAIDTAKLHLLVVGDTGRAIVFDCDFGSSKVTRGAVHTVYAKQKDIVTLPVHKSWFSVHEIHVTETTYVNTVRFLKDENMYLTATSEGEVKLWRCHDLASMGTLNSEAWSTEMLKS